MKIPEVQSHREDPDIKRMRLESQTLNNAICASLESHEQYIRDNSFATFDALKKQLVDRQIKSDWSLTIKNDRINFVYLSFSEFAQLK